MPDMHEIEYRIIGEDLQFVEVELDPNEATVAEAGSMMFMEETDRVHGRADGRRQAAAHR